MYLKAFKRIKKFGKLKIQQTSLKTITLKTLSNK